MPAALSFSPKIAPRTAALPPGGDAFHLSAFVPRHAPPGAAPRGGDLSVIVPTRGRPRLLARAVKALGLQTLTGFELILVGDAPDLPRPPAAARMLRLPCAEANVALARNIGAAAASGSVLAFLDDDATPEPGWLAALTAPFADPAVALAGGRARSWNGLSDEAHFTLIDGEARQHRIATAAEAAAHAGPERWLTAPRRAGLALSPLGAGHAARAADLAAIGGYDEGFAYHLEEADLALRLAAAGRDAVFAPSAEIQHLRAPSALRDGPRRPLCLERIGASGARFLARHAPPDRRASAAARMTRERAQALDALLLAGRIEPREARRLRQGFARGLVQGAAMQRPAAPAPPAAALPAAPTGAPETVSRPASTLWRSVALCGPAQGKAGLAPLADALAARGWIVTLIDLSPGFRPLRLRMTDEGWWLHSGGLWGRAERDGPRLRLRAPWQALAEELARAARRRAAAQVTLHRGTSASGGLISRVSDGDHAAVSPESAEIIAAADALACRKYVVVSPAAALHGALQKGLGGAGEGLARRIAPAFAGRARRCGPQTPGED